MKKPFKIYLFYNQVITIENIFSRYLSWFYSDIFNIKTYININTVKNLKRDNNRSLEETIKIFILYNDRLLIITYLHGDIYFLCHIFKKYDHFNVSLKSVKNLHINNCKLNNDYLKL